MLSRLPIVNAKNVRTGPKGPDGKSEVGSTVTAINLLDNPRRRSSTVDSEKKPMPKTPAPSLASSTTYTPPLSYISSQGSSPTGSRKVSTDGNETGVKADLGIALKRLALEKKQRRNSESAACRP